MLSENLLTELNKQMNYEFFSASQYLAMGAYCESENWSGFANFFLVQAEEERYHAMKIYHFINMLGRRAVVTELESPDNTFTSVLDTFESAFKHEKELTKKIYNLSDMALNEREHATINFLKWFVDEQTEEESMFDSIVEKLRRIEQDSNAFFMMDSEFADRSFTPGA